MYEELRPDGSSRMVGDLRDLYHQDQLREKHNRDRTTTNTRVDDEFISDMWRVMDTAGNLLIAKHHDYGPLNIARSPGGPINGLRVRMWDKVARINNLVDSKVNPSNESLRDSFMDLLNYSAIAIMVLDGKWPEVPSLDCE
jgi:argonaute-like protein implicated in RNA metabolism and viral defense